MHAIFTKFVPATDTRGSRIRAKFAIGGGAISVPYPHHLSGESAHELAARQLIEKFNPDLLLIESAGIKSGFVFIAASKKHYA